MPIFDFKCQECGNKFDLMISNADKEKVKCPSCTSINIKQLLSGFNTGSTKGFGFNTGSTKSAGPSCCQGCSAAANGACNPRF